MVASRFLFCGHDGRAIRSFQQRELFLELGKVGWTHTVLASLVILFFGFDGEQYLHTKVNIWFAA